MNATSGRLKLNVVQARLTRDTEFFGKMDPFAVIEYRQQKFKTKVKKNAGKTPRWDEQFTIDVKYIGDDFYVKVFDEDVTCNEAIGAVMMKMSAVC